MRYRRQILTYTILAAYAGIVLVGEGLHSLAPGHAHHHALSTPTCDACHGADHSCRHDSHECDADHDDAQPGLSATAGDSADEHECGICQFLVQAIGQPPQLAAAPGAHELAADLPCQAQGFYTPAILGLHAPRGPPRVS